jgi:hypothetical protein
MDGTGKLKLPSTPLSTGLSRVQHVEILNLNICRCVHTVVILEPSIFTFHQLPDTKKSGNREEEQDKAKPNDIVTCTERMYNEYITNFSLGYLPFD